MLTKSTDKFNLLIMDSKYGWISGKTYNPLEFIKGRLKPSTRSGGLKGYHIDFPTIQNLEGMREAFLKKSFMRASDTDDKIYVAIQMLVSNFTAPISFDGVLGRYSAVGIQRFINARGGDIEVNGIISKDVWNIFVNLL